MPPLRFGSDRDTLNKVFKEAIIKANFGPWEQPPSVLLGGRLDNEAIHHEHAREVRSRWSGKSVRARWRYPDPDG
jgi:hypothetical protein